MVDIVDVIRAGCRDHLEGGEVALNGVYGRLQTASLVAADELDGPGPCIERVLARRVPNLDVAIVVSNRRLLMLARSAASPSFLGVVASFGLAEVAALSVESKNEVGRLGIVFVDGSSALFGTETRCSNSDLETSFRSVRTLPEPASMTDRHTES